MIITSQGFGHFTQGLNNQDFGIETSRMLLVLDGCSGAKYSEVGTRLFAQLFSRKEECDNVDKFEDNVKEVFDNLIAMVRKFYTTEKAFEREFIMQNLLFTIIACFETKDKYVVKLFGDGYVISHNNYGCISYQKFYYGPYPPYYAYKYCKNCNLGYEDYTFKTFYYDKKLFSKIAIATDGIQPMAKGDILNIDDYIHERDRISIESSIRNNRFRFNDDVTIAMFGGMNNGVV